MNTTEAELKAVAKAIGSSLKRAGHTVPHSTVLHAVAAALDKRDWHKLKAHIGTERSPGGSSPAAAATPPQMSDYSERTWFFLRLAKALGRPVTALPAEDTLALAAALQACGNGLDGVLSWGGWNLPATLTFQTACIDAGDFAPDQAATAGTLTVRLAAGPEVRIEAGYAKGQGWYASAKGSAQFYEQLEAAVSKADVLGAGVAATDNTSQLQGPVVQAKFWTDDRTFEISFDARPYLMHAPEQALTAIINVGYVGDQCTDWVAEYVAQKGLNEDLSEAFTYLGALQKARRKDPVGFECEVDREGLLAWMAELRPELLALTLCERQGVSLVQAEEPESRGMWDWLDGETEEVCDQSFTTRGQAALDAFHKLNMLERELQG